MPHRIVVRSDSDNHILFSCFKAYYPDFSYGLQEKEDHYHSELEIAAFISGSGIYHCGGADYYFEPGDIFFHSGNAVHYFKQFNDGPDPALVVLRFDPRFVWSPGGEWFDSKYLKLFNAQASIRHKVDGSAPSAPVIYGLLNAIFDECHEQAPEYELLVKADLLTILANMARHFHDDLLQSEAPLVSARHLTKMEHSMNYILSHLDEPLTLELLAKEACMSRSYFSTMFKMLNGVSVWDYITSQRIDLAQYQLETTSTPIMQISENCGFNSIANFNRAFKKLTGKTPREYRSHVFGKDCNSEADNSLKEE